MAQSEDAVLIAEVIQAALNDEDTSLAELARELVDTIDERIGKRIDGIGHVLAELLDAIRTFPAPMTAEELSYAVPDNAERLGDIVKALDRLALAVERVCGVNHAG